MPRVIPVQIRSRALATALFLACTQALAADLTVKIENIQDSGGQVMVGLFDSADAFPKQAKLGQSVAASQRSADGSVKVMFSGLAEGTYVISAFHDKDGNGKLSTNLVGMPVEPYGFTGQGSGSFGPPAFQDVSFNLPDKGTAVTIAIK